MHQQWRQFDFHAAWQNTTHLWKQLNSFNHVKKKENANKKESTIRGISRRSTIQVLSSPDRVWLRGSNESRFFSLWYDRRQETFVNICHIVVPKEKNGQPSTITNHVQFLTKYSKRLKDKPLSKHYRVNLDLDDLEKARYPQMTQSLTERVLMFSLCCYRRQETFVNLGLFLTTSNYSWFLCLCLVMAFHSILFLYTSSLISKMYRGHTVKRKQDVLIYNSTCM